METYIIKVLTLVEEPEPRIVRVQCVSEEPEPIRININTPKTLDLHSDRARVQRWKP